jgi:glycosyltransferase involved in cell wall biosynthesis
MPARIAVDVTPLLYAGNGIHRCTGALVERLLQRRHDFDLSLVGRRLGGRRGLRIGPPGLGARRVTRLRLPRRAEPLIRSLGLIERTCPADLYHATDFYLPLKRPQRGIATIHDMIFLKQPEPLVDHDRLARWVGGFAHSCRAIITTSQWSKADIVRMLDVDPAKVHVVYWGVDRNAFFPAADPDPLRRRLASALGIRRPYFLAVSCSTERKNTPRLLRAYDRLLRQGASHDLVLVWSAPPQVRAQYERQIAAGRIHFTGRVSDELLRDLYAAAAATVYPSLDEGFGLPLLEAMSCGSPVIASDRSCIPEVARTAAAYINPEDEADIAAALERFENGDPALAGLRQLGFDRAAQFSWERCADETIRVYRAALAAA